MKFIFTCIITFLATVTFSQSEIRAFVASNTIPIQSISPDSLDFSDFESIGNSIGNARIVMLGEQDHGDAPTFLAKTRLIQYLHETKGFNVIAFESDFFSATYGFENIAKTRQDFLKFYKANIVPYWTLCDASNPLFTKVIPESFTTSNPYIVAGFDNQMFYKYSTSNLSQYIDSLTRENKLEILNNETLFKSILSSIKTLSNPMLCIAESKSFYGNSINDLTTLKNEFKAKKGIENNACTLIDNLIAFAQQLLKKNDFTSMVNTRDIQMTETLKWLCKVKFSNEKIIVWAANYHISKYMGHFKKKSLNDNISMATEFVKDKEFDKLTYSVGFTSYDGEAGRIGTKTFTVDSPDKNGLETWIDKSTNYAFIDFKKFNLLNPQFDDEFEMKSCVSDNNVHKSYPAQWNKIFDGIFFIRHMYPCKIKN
ncbi:MAG: erythromycin esterase family protein [Chitinophagaceae bacterium]|nr:erythromycin esterase family protein [Chitinophagaceae bacterium]